MSDEQLLDGNMSEEFIINDQMKRYLLETAKWAKFLAILGFVFIGFMLIIALFMGSFMSMVTQEYDDGGGFPAAVGGAGMSFFSVLIIAIYFFPTLYLYKFATKTQQALRSSDNDLLSNGMGQLKACFKFMGILMIVMLSLYALMFLILVLGVGLSGF